MKLLILLLSLLFEILKSEPPVVIHPTVWFGKIVGYLDKRLPPTLFFGGITLMITVLFAYFLSKIPEFLPFPFKILAQAYLLYSTISIRSMVEHAKNCIHNDRILPENVQKIVSRDTSKLSDPQLCSAVIESVSENFVDGVLSPLFYYALFGLEGALIYRAVNTCDAMLGYRTGKYERFGKIAARVDDVLNYIPSRLSLLLYALLSRRAIVCGIRKNPKLNGNSIAAMAGLLRVRLEKPGKYVIDCGREPSVQDVIKSIRYFVIISGISLILTGLLIALLEMLKY